MKRLLLALLVCGTAIVATTQTPQAAADCVHHRVHYYEKPGGALCGYTYVYCSAPSVHVGCTTPYWQNIPGVGCICP